MIKTFVIFVILTANSFLDDTSQKDMPNSNCASDELIGTGVWWVAGDAHVSSQAKGLEQALSDIHQLDLSFDYAIQLGDNVNDRHEYKDLYLETMETVPSEEYGYVLGNHDFGSDNKPVLPVKYWGETINGIRFLYISDEIDGSIDRDLIMNENQKRWFFEELETHSGKPIIIFAHQPHDEFAHFDELDFDSYEIKAWLHAHKHGWRINGMTEYGFHQLGINAISGHLDPRQSSVLTINKREDKTEFILKFRNHELEEWISVNDDEEYIFTVE